MTPKIFLFAVLAGASLLFAQTPAAPPAKLVVKNAFILTMATGQREPVKGYLVIGADGRLVTVAAGDPPAGLQTKDTLDAGGHWVIPGFLSAHSHLWQSAFRGLGADQTLMGWIDALYKPAVKSSPEDMYWFTLDGCLDHLQHGITAAYNFNYEARTRAPNAVTADDFDKSGFRAEMDSGIRFVHSLSPGRATAPGVQPSYGYEQARLPLKAFLDWTETQPKSPNFLSVMITGLTAFNTTYQQTVMEKQLGDEFHLANETHYLEPPETQYEQQSKFRWFMDSGLLSKNLIFGHFIHTNSFILAESAKAGASMSWNPLSNGRLASGVADIPAYLKAGIRVGMGVDGEASANVADPFENMRTGLYAVRDKYENATVMSPYDVLRLHTMGSADVMGVATTGQPGKGEVCRLSGDRTHPLPHRLRSLCIPGICCRWSATWNVYTWAATCWCRTARCKAGHVKERGRGSQARRRTSAKTFCPNRRRPHVMVVTDDNARLQSKTEVFYGNIF